MTIEDRKTIVYNFLNDHLNDECRNAKYMTELFHDKTRFVAGFFLLSKETKSGHLEMLTTKNEIGIIVAVDLRVS